MHIETANMAGGNTMRLEKIRRMAQENEVTAYFKVLYRHSVQFLESIPDDEMKEILSKNRNSRYIDEEERRMFPNRKDEDYSYEFGVLDSFRFGNTHDDYDMKDKNHVFMEAELVGTYGGEEYYDVVAYRKFEFSLDYRFMYMTLYLGKKEVYFEVVDYNYDDSLSEDEKAFLETLNCDSFLERIFGEYLIYNNHSGNFLVSEKFFED